jgi:DNA-binding response OmpR family regulator
MRKKILIVDDEAIIRKILELNLLDEGYEVDTAVSGEKAVAMLDIGYDLIITDLMMEGIDGLEVLKQAKKGENNSSVFILTGYGELDSAVSALRAGADDYLLKPYNHEELLVRVARTFKKQDMQNTLDLYEDILSICSECKKIRDDNGGEQGNGDWITIEKYLSKATGSAMSHGLCPDCYQKRRKELRQIIGDNGAGEGEK